MNGVLLVLGALVSPQDPGIDAAAEAFAAGRYAEARLHFEAALGRPGAPRGAILHDLGSCAYRLGEHAAAVLAFRRAQHWLPEDPAVAADLQLAERQLGIDRVAARAFDAPPPPRVQLAAAVLLQVLGLAGLLRRRTGRARRAAAALLLLLGLGCALDLVGRAAGAGPRIGVVLGAELPVRAEPHRDLPVLATLRAGEPVRVAEASDRWARIVHARGAGWVRLDGLGLVEH
jgi:tetratricopeptide (TPR) repeat protein